MKNHYLMLRKIQFFRMNFYIFVNLENSGNDLYTLYINDVNILGSHSTRNCVFLEECVIFIFK